MPTFNSGPIQFFANFALQLGQKLHDLDSDTIKALIVSSSYTLDLVGDIVLADISNELSGSGYARQTLAGVTWALGGDDLPHLLHDPLVWTASGGNIVGRRVIFFNDTIGSPVKPLICTALLKSDNTDVTITDGNTFTWVPDATNGLITITPV